MRRTILKTFCFFAIGAATHGVPSARVAQADTLRELWGSKAMQKVIQDTDRMRNRRDSRGHDVAWMVGMDPNSGFAELFATPRGPERLCLWTGAQPLNLKLGQQFFRRAREFAYCSNEYKTRAGEKFTMELIVPHPTYRDMVRLGTVSQFNSRQPPQLPVTASEQLDMNGFPATYYRYDKQKCSLLFKLPKDTLLNVWTPDCKWSKAMMEYVRTMDLPRVVKKLES